MRGIGIVVLLLCLVVHVQAQAGAPEYRLRVPTIDAFLNMIDSLPDSKLQDTVITNVIAVDIMTLYPDLSQISDDLLLETYNSLNLDIQPLEARHIWNKAIIDVWLRESNVNLAHFKQLSFRDYQIRITPVDFGGDGTTEYLLDIIKNGRFRPYLEFKIADETEYQVFLVAKPRSDGNYDLFETPLHWRGQGFVDWYPQSYGLQIIGFQDLNADGSQEWIVAGRHSNTGSGAGPSSQLHIMGWQNDHLVRIGGFDDYEGLVGSQKMPSSSWTFLDVDADPALEIIKERARSDNWGCNFKQISIANWDADNYQYVFNATDDYRYPDTMGCAWRHAEQLMWMNNYAAAIPVYQHGLQLAKQDADLSDYERQLIQYEQMRLTLAYALNNQPDAASVLLQEMAASQPVTDEMGRLIALMRITYQEHNPIDLCSQVYNFFKQYEGDGIGSYKGPIAPFVGMTIFENEMFIFDVWAAPANKSGCDAVAVISQRIQEIPIQSDISPVEQLEEQGIKVTATFTMDLNVDGHQEWLIWTMVEDNVFMLFSVDTKYSVTSYQSLRPPDEHTELSVIDLPNGEKSLVFSVFGHDRSAEKLFVYYVSCPANNSPVSPFGFTSLWRLANNELTWFHDHFLCEDRPFDSVFQAENHEIHAWTSLYPGDSLTPCVYIWSDAEENYVLATLDGKPYQPEIFDSENQSDRFAIEDVVYRWQFTFRTASLDEVVAERLLNQFDSAFADDTSGVSSEFIAEAHYYRALALEFLNRADEALAEYVTIYEAAPESVWGQLAALHLECVANCG